MHVMLLDWRPLGVHEKLKTHINSRTRLLIPCIEFFTFFLKILHIPSFTKEKKGKKKENKKGLGV